DGNDYKNSGAVTPLIRAIEEEVAGVAASAPIFKIDEAKIKVETGKQGDFTVFPKERKLVFANDKYFRIYPHRWLAGEAKQLEQPNQIILTKTLANRFFPHTRFSDMVGKVVLYADTIPLQVAGVVAEMTENSDFKFDGFISTATIAASA